MSRRRPVLATVAVAVFVAACGSEPGERARGGRSIQLDHDDAVGTCRSELAGREAAGSASVAWVSLSTALVNDHPDRVAVIRATGVRDAGERDVFDEHETRLIDQPHAVRFRGVQVLDGAFSDEVEVLMSAWAAYDASGITADGGYVIAAINKDDSGRYQTGPMVGVEDGHVVFPGDCHPAWRGAFADYASRQERRSPELVEEILVDPGGEAATAFAVSDEGRTGGGPDGRSGR